MSTADVPCTPTGNYGLKGMTDSVTLSCKVLEFIQKQGLNLRQIAAIVEIHPSELSKIKAGKREWTTTQLITLSKHMKLPIGGLLLIAMNDMEMDSQADAALNGLLQTWIDEMKAQLESRNSNVAKALAEHSMFSYGSNNAIASLSRDISSLPI